MKRFIIFLTGICLYVGPLWAQSPSADGSKNYIRTTTARYPVSSEATFQNLKNLNLHKDKQEFIQYVDGLGRPLEEVDWRSAPNGEDIVTFHDYDHLGREEKAFLPYVEMTNGAFTPLTTAQLQQSNFYDPGLNSGDEQAFTDFPFAITQFEASPLNRVLEQGAVGGTWQPLTNSPGAQTGNEHTVVQAYTHNDAPIQVPILANDCQSLNTSHQYPTGSLVLQEMTDENGVLVRTYQDKLGRTILESHQLIAGGGTSWQGFAHTAYVYDCFGRIAYVIQPEGYKALKNGNWNATVLEQFTFQYGYDERGRVIDKKVPGADWVYLIYDNRDRVVLTQDGNQRAAAPPEWSFTSYDALDRPVMTGIYKTTNPRTALTALATHPNTIILEERTQASFTDQTGELIEGYTHQAFPLMFHTACEVHSVTYYDDYDFDGDQSADMGPSTYTDSRLPNIDALVTDRTRGLATGIRTRVLNPDTDMPDWLWTVTWYDDRQRELITWSENHLSNTRNGDGWLDTWDRMQYTYSFLGEKTVEYHLHRSHPTNAAHVDNTLIRRSYTYNHRSLPTHTYESVARGQGNIFTDKLVLENTYNKLGQARRTETVSPTSGEPLQTTDWLYNERGWLTDINNIDDAYGEQTTIEITQLSVEGNHFKGTLSVVGELYSEYTLSVTYTITHTDCEGVSDSYQETQVFQTPRILFGTQKEWPKFKGKTIMKDETFSGGTVIQTPGEIPAIVLTTLYNLIDGTSGGYPSQAQGYAYLQASLKDLVESYFSQGDLFAMRLTYEASTVPTAAPLYNGNISSLEWRTVGECPSQAYGFQYDGLNRLWQATYRERLNPQVNSWIPAADDRFSTTYTYDLNGNFLHMRRQGKRSTGTYDYTDWLTYTYDGNRLMRVSDNISNTLVDTDFPHFKDGTNIGDDYTYDPSGNMTWDRNAGVAAHYNHLNKPVDVGVGGSYGMKYVYTADGTKLRQRTYITEPYIITKKVTDYVNGHQYVDEDGSGTAAVRTLEFAMSTGYRIMMDPGLGSFSYEFTLSDHLGNARVQYREIPAHPGFCEVVSTHDYYPYGLTMQDGRSVSTPTASQYLYNGKEFQDEYGLNWYDYGARMYNPTVGRWNGVDALAEDYLKWSPYNYTLCNPIRFVDPDGNSVGDPPDRVNVDGQSVPNGASAIDAGVDKASATRQIVNAAVELVNPAGVNAVYSTTFNAAGDMIQGNISLNEATSMAIEVDIDRSAPHANDKLQVVYEGATFEGDATLTGMAVAEVTTDGVVTRNISIEQAREMGLTVGGTLGPEEKNVSGEGSISLSESSQVSEERSVGVSTNVSVQGYIYEATINHKFSINYQDKGLSSGLYNRSTEVTVSSNTQLLVTRPLTPNP